MISSMPPRVGTMRHPIYTPSCYTETMAVPLPTTPQMGTWGGLRAAAVRRPDGWATRGVFLCARRSRLRSTPRLGAFGVNRCRLRHRFVAISRAEATAAAAVWKNDGFEFVYFAAKTVGCAAKWWSSHWVLEQEISSWLAFVWCSNYLCKILGEQQIRCGLSAPRR
jgi:hypothetical protein